MTEYPAGTVCVATVRGVPNVRVMRGQREWLTGAPNLDGPYWHADGDVTDVRPLVVLDPNVVSYAATALEGSSDNGDRYCAKQLRDALPKPPRIPEPGWGAIVKAHGLGAKGDRYRWVRGELGWTNLDATGEYLNWASWDELVEPTLVRPGIEDAS